MDASDGSRSGGGIGARVRRVAPLAGLTTRTVGEAAVIALRSRLTGESSAEFHLRTAERYAELLGHSKGALMKVGQILSFAAVGSAVPKEFQSIYQQALAGLRSEAPPMAPELARALLEAELGDRVDDFAELDQEPFAAASIGQVHAARLHDGRAVAVKVQYPGVAEAIRADLRNAELLATLMSLAVGGLFPRGLKLDLRAVAGEISAHIEEELDYRLEAANQAEFAEHYRGHPFIRIPEVVEELSTERVLTQELVRGLCWSEALAADQSLRDQWAEAIHRFVYGSYYRLGLFNADPHPGNYVFHEDGSVSFLDFGSVKRLRRDRIEMLVTIYRECMRGDVAGTWSASVEAGMWRSTDPVTPEEAFAYWREDNPLVWAQKRFVADPDCVGRGIERRFSPTGPSANALRYCTMPPDYALLARAEIGAQSVIAQLRAGNDWRSLALEYCWDAAPVTEMGKRERAFLERCEQEPVVPGGAPRADLNGA
ncbi:MAG TPA: AarF/ABC1/UbiB kinase family protein [Solirubrobacteraceae bacterium]|jgi:predicted unusual protein kinase regulating ubiquinone biosynthesis (AarF/ABC1/UbiB family)|nr:AarF/ABC1/UbiB kinase family protein [Solirubrobacteraceae bacterium]